MKKGKRQKQDERKTRSRLLWIAIAVIGIAAVISAVCVAGMLATKENSLEDTGRTSGGVHGSYSKTGV